MPRRLPDTYACAERYNKYVVRNHIGASMKIASALIFLALSFSAFAFTPEEIQLLERYVPNAVEKTMVPTTGSERNYQKVPSKLFKEQTSVNYDKIVHHLLTKTDDQQKHIVHAQELEAR